MSTTSQTVVLLGASQSGKSTVAGHLLHICETFNLEQAEEALLKSQKWGMQQSRKWCYLIDQQKKEILEGRSIHTSYHKLQTRKNLFTLIDTPGSTKYLNNCITGISNADIGVVVVSAVEEEFKKDLETTLQQVSLAFCLGIKNLIVVINKFDAVDWSNSVYTALSATITEEVKKCGYKGGPSVVLPVCGLSGDNLTKLGDELTWYKGLNLLSSLEECACPPRPTDKPFRMSVQQVLNIKGKVVLVGQVGSGSIKVGSQVILSPQQVVSSVKSIEMYGEEQKAASAGNNVGLCLENVNEAMLSTGTILSCYPDHSSRPVDRFVAQLQVKNGAPEKGINVGFTAIVDIHSLHIPCKFHRVLHTLNPKTGKPDAVNPKTIKKNDIAWVELIPLAPLCLEAYGDYPAFGRLTIRNGTSLVAIGVVKTVERLGSDHQGDLNCLEAKEE